MDRSASPRSTCASPSATSGAPGRNRPARSNADARGCEIASREAGEALRHRRGKGAPGRLRVESRERLPCGVGIAVQLQRLAIRRRSGRGLSLLLELRRLGQQLAHFGERAGPLEAAPCQGIARLDGQCALERSARSGGVAAVECRAAGGQCGPQLQWRTRARSRRNPRRRHAAWRAPRRVRACRTQHPPRPAPACRGRTPHRPTVPRPVARARRDAARPTAATPRRRALPRRASAGRV